MKFHRLLALLGTMMIFIVPSAGATPITISSLVNQYHFAGKFHGPLEIATYDFTGQPFDMLASIESISVTLTIDDGDTASQDFDYTHLTFGLDGYDTGVQLNGFRNHFLDTRTITATPAFANDILSALQSDGQLVGTIIDEDYNDNYIELCDPIHQTTLNITGETTTPEPTTICLVGFGILVLLGVGIRQRRKET